MVNPRSKVKLHWIDPVQIIGIVGVNLYKLRDCTRIKMEKKHGNVLHP